MATANLSWSVDEATLASLLAFGYDAWLIEREVPGPIIAEVSYPTTRPPLIADCYSYIYADPAAPVDVDQDIDPTTQYRAYPYRTSDGAQGAPVTVSFIRRGYITPQDVWDEGYANPPWTPEKVWRGIERAMAVIENVCGQWFEPRYSQFIYDGVDHDEQWLDQPICALHQLLQDDTVVDLTDLEVYNRHLTRGQLHPDDRNNPKVTYALDYPPGYRGRSRRLVADAALFSGGRKNVTMKGVFGYTELGPGEMPAETAQGSQLPIFYGQVPSEIQRAALLLTLTYMLPAEDQNQAFLLTRYTGTKTRDQSITFSGPSNDADGSYGMTGNIEVDNILMRYAGPMSVGTVGR